MVRIHLHKDEAVNFKTNRGSIVVEFVDFDAGEVVISFKWGNRLEVLGAEIVNNVTIAQSEEAVTEVIHPSYWLL